MAMGKRRRQRQQSLWVETKVLEAPGHPFYRRLNKILDKHGFDDFVEELCARFYADEIGRPSMPPAVYFRLLLIGYFEGLRSERGIAWRVADSISLRHFLGYELSDSTPDHSTISRTRRLIDSEAHGEVFSWVLQLLAKSGLLKGKTLGIDSTTLEANAAMRSIVRHDTGESYTDYLKALAEASGTESPTQADVARFDRQRKGRSTSNRDWKNPHDPDAKVSKMKDGRTRMAHKAEHAVDLETGAVVSVTVQPADRGDTRCIDETLEDVQRTLEDVIEDRDASARLSDQVLTELVADKGYHSNAVLKARQESEIRTYFSEPKRGRRKWKGKEAEKRAVYNNRRRIRGNRGKKLLRQRSEKVERSFAHCYDTGGLRRTYLRGHENIRKRALIHVASFNLGLLLRQAFGVGTPRGLQGLLSPFRQLLTLSYRPAWALWRSFQRLAAKLSLGEGFTTRRLVAA